MGTMIKHPKDFYAGMMYFSVGAAAAYIARDYTMGTAVRMGPAYFPTILAIMLMVVGAISVVRSFLRNGQNIDAFAWKEIGLIIGSIVLFGVLVRGAGLGPALLVLVLVSAWASPEFRLKTALLLALITTVLSVLVFVTGLGLPFPILGSWFGM